VKQAKLLGAKWNAPQVVVGFRAAAPLARVFELRDKQLQAQGFQRTRRADSTNEINASYRRANDALNLKMQQVQTGAYRATFDLAGMRPGN
jgi:hypothetical protein